MSCLLLALSFDDDHRLIPLSCDGLERSSGLDIRLHNGVCKLPANGPPSIEDGVPGIPCHLVPGSVTDESLDIKDGVFRVPCHLVLAVSPMSPSTSKSVYDGSTVAWFFAASPIRSPSSMKATYNGVIRLPWPLAMVSARPFPSMPTQEYVFSRPMPIAGPVRPEHHADWGSRGPFPEALCNPLQRSSTGRMVSSPSWSSWPLPAPGRPSRPCTRAAGRCAGRTRGR